MILRDPDIQLDTPTVQELNDIYPAEPDSYKGPSFLRFFTKPVPKSKMLPKPKKTKMIPSSQVLYQEPYYPPETDDLKDVREQLIDKYVGSKITKRYYGGMYQGIISSSEYDEDTDIRYWIVDFEIGESEQFLEQDVIDRLNLHKFYPDQYDFFTDEFLSTRTPNDSNNSPINNNDDNDITNDHNDDNNTNDINNNDSTNNNNDSSTDTTQPMTECFVHLPYFTLFE